MNARASTHAVPSPIEGSGTAWVSLGSWALSPARPTPIHPRRERRGFSALLVIAGHKGQPEVGKSTGRQGRRRRLKGKAGRGTLEKERPPVFGRIQRGGQVVIKLLANVQQK